MASSNESYLIIGAGIFGASTARHLIQEKPGAIVTLLDRTPFPNPSSASHDVNKIIRPDYEDSFYMTLALESMEHWQNDPLYRPYYHETGMVFVEDRGTGKAIIENYKSLGYTNVNAEMLPPEDARGRWGGIFKRANWDGAEECFWNPNSGWAEAEGALRDTIKDAVRRGVKYHEATVTTLVIDITGACTGVRTTGGELYADHIVLCTGAFTAKLLADTAPTNKKLQVSGRLVAAGAVSCTARIAPELTAKFKNAPVLFNGLKHTRGESVPINRDGQLKFNCENSVTRMEYHAASEQYISVPPQPERYSTWNPGLDVPKGFRDEVDNVVRNMFGDIGGIQIEFYWMCWDAITPNQDFMICQHPYCKNLSIATGGSFHGYKFSPIIGKFVVRMLNGTLEKEAADRRKYRCCLQNIRPKTRFDRNCGVFRFDRSLIDGYSFFFSVLERQ